ncbi:MAG: RsmB/NOP family class I SAM-dependent RNA methyltransferase [Candidatus Kapaibacterium sp.]
MQPSSLYGHVVEAYSEFQKHPAVPADAVMRRFFLERKYLGAKDRRFIADTYFGTIKNWRRLEALVQDSFEDGEVTAESIVHDARTIAAFAIVFRSESSQTIREAFAKFQLPTDALSWLADRDREAARLALMERNEWLGILHSFPTWFVARMAEEYGIENVEPILAALNGEAPAAIRANTILTSREELRTEFQNVGIETTPSEIAPDALILGKRVNVFGLPEFQRGAFEVQDEASQLVAPFANIRKTAIKALDACAGAGGKTLHLSALMKNHGEIFATDPDPRKLEALKQRSRRSGAQNIRIVLPEQRERMLGPDKTEWFDLVLLDAPCTGTGTLRRNPGIKWLLTEQMLAELVEKQRMILEENLRFVKPGGTLLYATCSLLKEEGEAQMEWFTAQHPEFSIEETLRTRPDLNGSDGFFAARLKHLPK